MKKLLGILAVLALVVPASAGNIFSNVETSGEIQTIGALTENANNHSSIRDTSNRVILGVGMDLTEDVRANLSFLNTYYWGTADEIQGDTVYNKFLRRTYVNEANVALSNVFGALDVKVGRQFYGDENSTVMYFGPTHYRVGVSTQTNRMSYTSLRDAYSLDAAVVSYGGENWSANVIYGKTAEQGEVNDTDISLGGIDTKINLTHNVMLQAYLYDIRDGNEPSEEGHIGIWGVKPSFSNDEVNASVEFAKNYQDQVFGQNDRGWLVKADAKVNMTTPVADVSPRIGFTHSEKEFIADGNYMPGLIFSNELGQMFAGNANFCALQVVNAGVDFKLPSLSKFSFSADYFAFSKSANNSQLSWLGNEIDLMAKYAFNEYAELHAGVGYMVNVKQGFAYQNNDPYTGQLGMIVKF